MPSKKARCISKGALRNLLISFLLMFINVSIVLALTGCFFGETYTIADLLITNKGYDEITITPTDSSEFVLRHGETKECTVEIYSGFSSVSTRKIILKYVGGTGEYNYKTINIGDGEGSGYEVVINQGSIDVKPYKDNVIPFFEIKSSDGCRYGL